MLHYEEIFLTLAHRQSIAMCEPYGSLSVEARRTLERALGVFYKEDAAIMSLAHNQGSFDEKFALEGFTFDDVLIVPAASSVLPHDVSTRTRLTRTIDLNIPIVSAAMDTVTEARLAIALAREGGIGIVHRNLSIEDQAQEVDKVKRSEAGMITDPVTMEPSTSLRAALASMQRFHI